MKRCLRPALKPRKRAGSLAVPREQGRGSRLAKGALDGGTTLLGTGLTG